MFVSITQHVAVRDGVPGACATTDHAASYDHFLVYFIVVVVVS